MIFSVNENSAALLIKLFAQMKVYFLLVNSKRFNL